MSACRRFPFSLNEGKSAIVQGNPQQLEICAKFGVPVCLCRWELHCETTESICQSVSAKFTLPENELPHSSLHLLCHGCDSPEHPSCGFWGGCSSPVELSVCTSCLPLSHQLLRGRLTLAHHSGTRHLLGAVTVAMLRGTGNGSQPCVQRGCAGTGTARSSEADLHPSVSKCTQIISLLRGIGITSRWLKEERQRPLSQVNHLPRH